MKDHSNNNETDMSIENAHNSSIFTDVITVTGKGDISVVMQGSFYVKWTKKMEKSTHYLRFSSNFITRWNFSYWFQKTKFFWNWLRFREVMDHTKWLLIVVNEA